MSETVTGLSCGKRTAEREPLLSTRGLSVEFRTPTGWRAVTHGVDLDVARGETVALVGESGSGKSVTAMSVADLLPPGARRTGSVQLAGEELLEAAPQRIRELRGSAVAVVFQEPMTALNPVHTIGRSLSMAVRAHRALPAQQTRERCLDLLRRVGLPDPERRMRQYPHQLSGGQRQRAMIAMAIANDPALLIADEPTTALDVTAQAAVLDLLTDLQDETGMGLLLITHDMGVVAEVADRVVVMNSGRVVETGTAVDLFARPRDQYTRDLLAAVPHLGRAQGPAPAAAASPGAPVLTFEDVVVEYRSGVRRDGFRAVDGVSLDVRPGEVVGLVGESGSGKSTLGRLAVGLLRARSGRVHLADVDLNGRPSRRQLATLRKQAAIIFQDPASSLNPRWTIGEAVAAPLRWNGVERDRRSCARRASELLDRVQLPASWADRYPHELSGGQRQRVGIARALALQPRLLVADEPTSALDVSVQAAVLDLFAELQTELRFACLFISHDLSVVERLATRVVVLRGGRVVETGPTGQVLHSPREAYTRELVEAVPVPDPVQQADRRNHRRTGAGRA